MYFDPGFCVCERKIGGDDRVASVSHPPWVTADGARIRTRSRFLGGRYGLQGAPEGRSKDTIAVYIGCGSMRND